MSQTGGVLARRDTSVTGGGNSKKPIFAFANSTGKHRKTPRSQ